MAHDLQDIIEKIGDVQKTIKTPGGEKSIQHYYDEPPGAISVFPCFVNIEEGIEETGPWQTGGRMVKYVIAMHLLFDVADQKYSQRTRRKWIRPVLDAFGVNITPDSAASVAKAFIESAEFETVTFGQTNYLASTFRLSVIVEEAFEWGV